MSDKKIKVNKEEKKVKVFVDTEFYDLDAIYDAAYHFLDRAFVFLDGDSEGVVEVTLKSKRDSIDLEELGSDFFNELINTTLRSKVSKENKMVREYVVSAALVGASKDLQKRVEEKREASGLDGPKEGSEWDEDPLEITKSWEEKYGKNEKEKADTTENTSDPEDEDLEVSEDFSPPWEKKEDKED